MKTSDAPLPDSIAGLRVQNGALRTLNAALEFELAAHRERSRESHLAISTLESERAANAALTEQLDALNDMVEHLGDKLYLLSDLIRDCHFFDKPENHAAYEAVVAAFLALRNGGGL